MYISQGTGAVDTAAHLSSRISSENDIDFIAHIGDLSYGEGNVAVWETFMSIIEPLSSRVPYLVSIGNHE